MKSTALTLIFASVTILSCHSQINNKQTSEINVAAGKFLVALSSQQKQITQFRFEEDERYNWHFIPKNRKGIAIKDLNSTQRKTFIDLLHASLGDTGFQKTNAIVQLEDILRIVENRPANDEYRNAGKYYISIFGNPLTDSIWGWRFEGHHISLNFSLNNNRLVSATPNFLGANPAVVLNGPEKGKQILKDETELGFELLHSLDSRQKEKAIINVEAPADIITGASRKAIIDDSRGILYHELNGEQQKVFMQLLSIYIHRYTRLFAMDMMNEIMSAGLNNLLFAWAGEQQIGLGHPHYYRIKGPTIIIEYDNTQNNANHVHTVVRDLKNDFGGDELLEHYKQNKH
ncbi:MAG TPA: DUF3500 domain-containing protein [Chitinophagaceae bacterium]|jgi:hypothetical protein|nr:DUF3500 domain-containing protein [Chitinophagaceae bacterium]